MAIILIIGLFWLAIYSFSLMAGLEMNNETRLAFNIIGGIACLAIPIVIYSYIDFTLVKRATKKIGVQWCSENKFEFIGTETSKNHISILYKDSGKVMRKKLRMHMFPTTWIVQKVEWL